MFKWFMKKTMMAKITIIITTIIVISGIIVGIIVIPKVIKGKEQNRQSQNSINTNEEELIPKVIQNVSYEMETDEFVGRLVFSGNEFEILVGARNSGASTVKGSYTIKQREITFQTMYSGDEGGEEEYKSIWQGKISNDGKDITVINEYGTEFIFSLNLK